MVGDNDLKRAYLRALVFGAEGMGYWGPYLGAEGERDTAENRLAHRSRTLS